MNPRFYLPQTLVAHTQIALSENLSKHLQVLRCKEGEMITLFDGQGYSISARIDLISKKVVKVTLQDDLTQQPPQKLKLHLGQALCRFDRMDLILQKAVELNVSDITPIYAERSQGRLKGEQLERKMLHWHEILISASEQCNQDYLPQLHEPVSLQDWLSSINSELKLQCALQDAVSLKSIPATPHSVALLIGPEGGLTEPEMILADQHNFTRINLGERILRVETAAILALGLVNYQFFD